MTVVVAGAGVAGLAAALDLADAGHDVLVVDPAPAVGGMVRTSAFAGRMVDEAADAFLVRTPAALEVARRVGLGPSLVHPVARQAQVWHDGMLSPLPPQVLGVPVDLDALAASGLVSAETVGRLRSSAGAGPDRLDVEPLGDADVSVGDAVASRIGEEAYAVLVEPLVGGISAGDPRRLSLAAVAPQLDAACRDTDHPDLVAACRAQLARARASGTDPDAPVFAAPAAGMAGLPAAMARVAIDSGRVEIRLDAGVAALGPGRSSASSASSAPVAVALADGSEVDAEAVVVATPGPVAGRLLNDVAPTAVGSLEAVDHVSVAFVRVALRPEDIARPLEGSGALVPRSAGLRITACSWASRKWARLAPGEGDGTEIVRAAVGRDGDDAALDLDDADLIAAVVEDLDRMVGLRAAPTEASVHRWPAAFPQYRPGHLGRVAAMEAHLAERAPRVAIAGMHLRGVGIPASIASGRAAAARLLALFG